MTDSSKPPSGKKMICWILLLIKLSCCVCAPTFEVNATQSFYQAEEKQNVTLEWTFPPPADGSLTSLLVICWKVTDVKVFKLFELIGGDQFSEDEQFAGRVHCDTDVLKEGRLRLHVSSLRTEDSGRYLCNVRTESDRGLGESLLNVSGCSVSAIVGDDVVLPVHLKTKLDTSDIKVSWKLNNTVVHTYRHGRDYLDNQNENFKGRTSMFEDEIAEGNVSLRLKNVTEEDSGTYTCTVVTNDQDEKEDYVSLSVEPRKSPDEGKDWTTSPPPNKDQSGGLSAGVIVGIVVVLIGVILGVFLYKRRIRNNRNNRNRGQPGADGVDETELDKLSARQDQVQNDHDDWRCPTEAPGETEPLSDPPNRRDAPLNESFQNPSQHV